MDSANTCPLAQDLVDHWDSEAPVAGGPGSVPAPAPISSSEGAVAPVINAEAAEAPFVPAPAPATDFPRSRVIFPVAHLAVAIMTVLVFIGGYTP
ncbi:hypothetical protein CF319_g8440 [Tilletia indica]|uniref:Uncharacterized protein n=1 Tax=Tilletia indica TaxID=43049 RepID=A0A177T1I5_9BASI|nr:hypothetical protein CF319_g8440 [Tilletia indica]KAE8220170.1 hypothetical protein CF326_g8803 [Tilletia indica]KAE8237610.1 hypothetical protein A4X13_0g8714 [Tilletia indica]